MLRARGNRDKITAFCEELDFGPISNGPLKVRATWLDQMAPHYFVDRHDNGEGEDQFRHAVSSDEDRLIWFTPASATEQAGLQWYLSNFGSQRTSIVIADFPIPSAGRKRPPVSLGELKIEEMELLLNDCPREPLQASRFGTNRWNELVAENTLLRVVEQGQLRSVSDSYFDADLLASCPQSWTKWISVIGQTIFTLAKAGHNVGTDLLMWRLRTLIKGGKIACDGELPMFGETTASATIRRTL